MRTSRQKPGARERGIDPVPSPAPPESGGPPDSGDGWQECWQKYRDCQSKRFAEWGAADLACQAKYQPPFTPEKLKAAMACQDAAKAALDAALEKCKQAFQDCVDALTTGDPQPAGSQGGPPSDGEGSGPALTGGSGSEDGPPCPTITIVDVVRGPNMPNSIRPTGITLGGKLKLAVTIEPPLPAPNYVEFDVVGQKGGATDGSARVTASNGKGPARLSRSGTIEIEGLSQTQPAYPPWPVAKKKKKQAVRPGPLQVRARLNGTQECKRGTGFTVCAHPESVEIFEYIDVDHRKPKNPDDDIGVLTFLKILSDTGKREDLSAAERKECVALRKRPNPPFKKSKQLTNPDYGGIVLDDRDLDKADKDGRVQSRANISPTADGVQVVDQLFLFRALRGNS